MTRLVSFEMRGSTAPWSGALEGDRVRAIGPGSLSDRLRDALPLTVPADARTHALADVRLLAPVPAPPSVRDCFAFEQHVRAAHRLRGRDLDPAFFEAPVFYFSNPGGILGDGDELPVPQGSRELDYELELAVVIGTDGRNIAGADAWRHVLGITVMNAWSARDLQRAEMRLNLGPAKGKDFGTSLGPCIVTLDELGDRLQDGRHNLVMTASVNGRELSRGNARDMHWTFPQLIAHASRDAWVRAGDVIGSGTVGTGCILELRPENTGGWLKPGDEVVLEIERIGALRNRVVPEDARYRERALTTLRG